MSYNYRHNISPFSFAPNSDSLEMIWKTFVRRRGSKTTAGLSTLGRCRSKKEAWCYHPPSICQISSLEKFNQANTDQRRKKCEERIQVECVNESFHLERRTGWLVLFLFYLFSGFNWRGVDNKITKLFQRKTDVLKCSFSWGGWEEEKTTFKVDTNQNWTPLFLG